MFDIALTGWGTKSRITLDGMEVQSVPAGLTGRHRIEIKFEIPAQRQESGNAPTVTYDSVVNNPPEAGHTKKVCTSRFRGIYDVHL